MSAGRLYDKIGDKAKEEGMRFPLFFGNLKFI